MSFSARKVVAAHGTLIPFILRFLSHADVAHAAQVCSLWNKFANNPSLWRDLLQTSFVDWEDKLYAKWQVSEVDEFCHVGDTEIQSEVDYNNEPTKCMMSEKAEESEYESDDEVMTTETEEAVLNWKSKYKRKLLRGLGPTRLRMSTQFI